MTSTKRCPSRSRACNITALVTLTRSLGRRLAESPEVYAWADAGACEVQVTFEGGHCRRWQLERAGILESAPR